ncbi:response regulator [Chryseosolibacter indicus]|uniref:Response regulator n=1 Tax=Chryseosolibacter indicus TaxID=2782351 RepID=A0ABS5W0A0_9BACT|nr:response regulator [Chryseosolibacter indicus]MBT1705706.1 response regulator [Chryseosolibacter indicus]
MNNARTIFLIDDDEDDRWLFTEALARTVPSVKCSTASDGREAIEMLQAARNLPDLIFLDLNMPGMDGKKILTQIKQIDKLSSIPIIVYSTSNYHKDIEETKRLGATDFIIKPSDYTQLCNMFRELFK